MSDIDPSILDTIDQATGCMFCGGPLGDSVSDMFCNQDHQTAWYRQNTAAGGGELPGYREPAQGYDGTLPYRGELPPEAEVRADDGWIEGYGTDGLLGGFALLAEFTACGPDCPVCRFMRLGPRREPERNDRTIDDWLRDAARITEAEREQAQASMRRWFDDVFTQAASGWGLYGAVMAVGNPDPPDIRGDIEAVRERMIGVTPTGVRAGETGLVLFDEDLRRWDPFGGRAYAPQTVRFERSRITIPQSDVWEIDWTERRYGRRAQELGLVLGDRAPLSERVERALAGTVPEAAPLWTDEQMTERLRTAARRMGTGLVDDRGSPRRLTDVTRPW